MISGVEGDFMPVLIDYLCVHPIYALNVLQIGLVGKNLEVIGWLRSCVTYLPWVRVGVRETFGRTLMSVLVGASCACALYARVSGGGKGGQSFPLFAASVACV